jgi:ABC-type multidrug transport system ATPase subunit
MNNELIILSDISKNYGRNQILSNLDLTIKERQSIALLGNNGSGKSTLLRIICGLTNISSGELSCTKKIRFNYIPENFPKMNITAQQYIKHMRLIEGFSEQSVNDILLSLSSVEN